MLKLIGLTAILAFAGCKSESARKADNAAEKVQEERKDLAKEQNQAMEHSKDIAKQGGELGKANAEFATQRGARIQALRAEHAVIATQPMLISTMAQNFALTDAARANVHDKLRLFQMRLDETTNLIEGLKNVDASMWKDRDDAIRDAMQKLHDARDAAWDALNDAPRVERPARS